MKTRLLVAGLGIALSLLSLLSAERTCAATIGSAFAGSYSITNLGSIDGVPAPYGGLTLLAGDNNTLLIGGLANSAAGNLYTVGVTRGAGGHITGFSGAASLFGPGPFNDGGLTYGPGGVLFASQWPANQLSQYLPGSTSPDKVIDLAPLGVAQSNSAIGFVPAGFGGAGTAKLVSWSGGEFYTATLVPDGFGTFDITSVVYETTLPGGPEGFAYVPVGSPEFSNPSMIVSEYSAGEVGAYELDGNGNPIVGTRRSFIEGLTGAEGAFIDPLTGDFLFSTFGGGNEVFLVTGFAPPPQAVPEPTSLAVFLGVGALVMINRRRRNSII